MATYKYNEFVKSILGDHGFEAMRRASFKMPEITNAIPAQTILSWVEAAARTEFNGKVPSTDNTFSIAKNDKGYTVTLDGNSAHIEHVTQAATIIADLLGFSPDGSPTLRKSQVDQLSKTIGELAQLSLIKAGGVQARGKAANALPPSGANEQVAKQTQPMTQTKATSIPKMGSGAGPTKPQTAPPPMPKAGMTAEAPSNKTSTKVNVGGAKPPKPPTMKSEPRVAAFELAKAHGGCPRCNARTFSGEKFVGCGCFGDLAKSTYSKRVEQGYVVFFNYQWDSNSIQKLIGDYRG
jgi:hypothetical protein